MKKIVVLPGGFHPFHAGHLALYQQALSKFPDADVYMAASDNQKERPFPFKVKQLLATEVAGIPKNKFVQVGGSPFNPDIITKNYNSSEDALIFVRSEKDRKEHPLPDQIRKKDGKMGYLLSYPGKDERLKPFADHGYIDYLPVAEFSGGMTSATEIRNAWPKLDELGKIELIKGMYPGAEMTVPKIKKISQILDSVLIGELVESFVSPEQLDEGLKQKLATAALALGLQFGQQVNADEVYVYQDTQGQLQTAQTFMQIPDDAMMSYVVDTDTQEIKYIKAPEEKETQTKPEQPKNSSLTFVGNIEPGMTIDQVIKLNPNLEGTNKAFTRKGAKVKTGTRGFGTRGGTVQNIIGNLGGMNTRNIKVHGNGQGPYGAKNAYYGISFDNEDKVNGQAIIIDKDELPKEWLDDSIQKGIGSHLMDAGQIKRMAARIIQNAPKELGGRVGDPIFNNGQQESMLKLGLGTAGLIGNTGVGLGVNSKLLDIKSGDYVITQDFQHGKIIIGGVVSRNTYQFYEIGIILNSPNTIKFNEAFVDPDQSKQYWNHDAQKVGVGMMIDMPLTDKPNLNGRRQGFNEGEERSIIRDAAIDALVNAYEEHVDKFESRGALEANIYSNLSRLNVEDIVDPEMDHHGQRMGNFASGRVIDVVNSSSVMDEVMQQLNYFDTDDDRNYVSESLNKIRGMIKETTDEQKSRSVHLHRKLFELMEEEKKNNVVKLRGFGREVDKPIPDLNRVRAEKEKEQERENNRYSERRAEQEELLARLQAELLNAKQEFSELADAQLLPIEMIDTMESIDKLIDFIENWEGSEAQNNFPFTESILEKLQLKTVQLKEYFGGMRDTSAPRVLRKQTPKLSPKAFWNTIDLSETADYIEEK